MEEFEVGFESTEPLTPVIIKLAKIIEEASQALENPALDAKTQHSRRQMAEEIARMIDTLESADMKSPKVALTTYLNGRMDTLNAMDMEIANEARVALDSSNYAANAQFLSEMAKIIDALRSDIIGLLESL